MSRRRLLLLVAGVLALLLLASLLIQEPRSETAGRARDETAARDPGASETGIARSEPRSLIDEPSRSVAEPGPGVLVLHVLSNAGAALEGSVYWVSSEHAPLASKVLAPDQEYSGPGSELRSISHDGHARLEIPAGHWTWLRATGRAKGGQILGRYERVPPFSGRLEKQLWLDSSTRRLHVFLLESDLVTPARRKDFVLVARSASSSSTSRS